ncbi:MAG: acyl transferase [Bacteroidetes bacterium]|nr:acyl transferase [Bacteroidota bacterium]MCL2303381.1 acyltransferase [Lentimicrobiaceae bacterium]
MNLENIFHSYSEVDFQEHALALFRYQYEQNEVYSSFCDMLKTNPKHIATLAQIPFLPISFFKTHEVKTGNFVPEMEFWSSGTTAVGARRDLPLQNENSKHFIKDIALYEHAFLHSFQHFYGNPADYCFLALLPNYLEQKHSSLIYMMNRLISGSKYAESGFYLYNLEELHEKIIILKQKKIKTILFGVSFALLDFAEKFTFEAPDLMVFETGGMKGRRPEMVKEELHQILCNAFGVKNIYSEYGMCELLSQAYSHGQNRFATPPWMKLLLRDEKDPLFCSETLSTGAINVIDFANLYSCAFIATDDLGKKAENDTIEILGRLDTAQIRGCNLLYVN